MTATKKAHLWPLLALAALVVAACGGDGDANSGEFAAGRTHLAARGIRDVTDADVDYLLQVEAAFDLFGSAAASAHQEALESGGRRETFLGGLRNAGAGTAFDPVLEALRAIDVPASYVTDHSRLIDSVAERVEIDRRFGAAVEANDLAALALENVALGRAQGRFWVDASRHLCLLTDGPDELCAAAGTLPGGAYGAEVDTVLRRLSVAADPSGAAFVINSHTVIATDAEVQEVLGALAADAEAAYAIALEALGQLTPPAAFGDDHASLTSLLSAEGAFIGTVPESAEAASPDIFEPSGAIDAEVGEGRCGTVDNLSDDFRAIARAVFPEELVATCAMPGTEGR